MHFDDILEALHQYPFELHFNQGALLWKLTQIKVGSPLLESPV